MKKRKFIVDEVTVFEEKEVIIFTVLELFDNGTCNELSEWDTKEEAQKEVENVALSCNGIVVSDKEADKMNNGNKFEGIIKTDEVAATQENEVPTFTEILTHVQENTGLKVIGIGKSYFTVENQEGYRAYFQVDTYGYHYENPHYYKGFSFSTCHKPNRSTGTGWQHIYLQYNATLDEIVTSLYETLGRSRHNIITGKEKMDTREK